MARSVSSTNWWEYWIPGWNQYLQVRDLFNGEGFKGSLKAFTNQNPQSTTLQLGNQANSILGEAEASYLADREHTEMREDTAYQRAVADMQKAGLNPYTVGASPASSSASAVGSNVITNKLEILGYILNLKKLDSQNVKQTNEAISNYISALRGK